MTMTKKQNEEILKEAKKAVSFVFDKCFLITWCKDTEEINQYFKDNIDNFIILKKNIKNNEYLNKFSETVLKLYNEEQDKQEEITKEKFSQELQKLILLSPLDKIKKALIELNFKGKIQTNKILLSLQLLQTFNTSEKIESLLNKLEK